MRRRTGNGFTLIELMITVAIIGILAAIAYPSYRQTVMRSNRSEAKASLMQTAGELEKCYTTYFAYNKYGSDSSGNVYCQAANQFNSGATFNTPKGYYRISATLNTSTFLLTATPLGAQANDTRCGTLTLDNLNAKTESGTGTVSDCW